jgi:hypothetical protein
VPIYKTLAGIVIKNWQGPFVIEEGGHSSKRNFAVEFRLFRLYTSLNKDETCKNSNFK